MAQYKGISSSSAGDCRPRSISKPAPPSPQLLLIELKQRIIASLNKLADRDTQHIAVEELERIAETLSPEGISLCLSCLYDTDTQQKSAVRKECVRMFGTLASLHEDLLSPHLSKIVLSIVKRLRDPDSSIRDACVDTMGTLAAKVCPPNVGAGGSGESSTPAFPGSLGVFAKPLFDVLNEQGRSVQVGAAMCLAEVVDNLKDLPSGSLQRLCPRIIKLLNNPTFTAKAALLSVIASIVQAGGAASHQCLAMVMACIQECLKSNDWATRKAASETLASMASASNCLNLSAFKSSVLESLEGCRFDKVKPVRDMVIQTQHVWRRMPDSVSGTDTVSAFKENTCSESKDSAKSKRKFDGVGGEIGAVLKNVDQNNSDSEALDFGCFGFAHARSGASRIHGEFQRKRVPLLDKRANAHGFGRTAKKDNWQIEIAVPLSAHDDIDVPKQASRERRNPQELVAFGRIVDKLERLETSLDHGQAEDSSEKTISCETSVEGTRSIKNRSLISKRNSCVDSSSQFDEVDAGSWSVGLGTIDSSTSSSTVESQASISENDSHLIRKQLCHIESQQAAILELLQKFMHHTEESLHKLEVRISGVETTVANLVKDVSLGKCDTNHSRCSSKLHDTSDQIISKYTSTVQWPVSSECLSTLRTGRKSPQRSPRIGMGFAGLDELRIGPAASASASHPGKGNPDMQLNSWRALSSDASQHWSRISSETESKGSFSGSTREAGLVSSRIGESSSERCTWQASNDEAGIVAATKSIEAGRMKTSESLKVSRGSSQLAMEQTQEMKVQRVGGQQKGPFWSLWARAAEYLRAGDVDSAYVEVLCAGDELLLVRLMSRTGPVLQQLSEGTIHELMRNVVQLMSQQSFLDVMIPWLQQVADLVTNNGSDCFSVPLDTRKEIMASLQEASSSDYSEKWVAARLHELTVQLRTAWGAAATA